MERGTESELTSHLLSQVLINGGEHDPLQAKSCNTCKTDFLDVMPKVVNEGKSVLAIFLYMTKAFDRVLHRRLLTKIGSYGVSDPMFVWFSSYFLPRKQVVQVNGTPLTPRLITSAAIQKCPWCSTFLMHVNDIFHVIKLGTPFLFVDHIKTVQTYHPSTLHTTIDYIAHELLSLTICAKVAREFLS